MKKFNVTGACDVDKHYMVDISDRLCQMKKMVDDGNYFVINRARQYGKTTTLSLLKKKLEDDYIVFFISFEGFGDEQLDGMRQFTKTFLQLLQEAADYDKSLQLNEQARELLKEHADRDDVDFLQLGQFGSKFCSIVEKPVVLLIDEVDQAGNYNSFITFLGMLRARFLQRSMRPTFHSVILAGVYDIKNLKMKVRNENEHQYNSPWNIATAFTIPMDFDTARIVTMLEEYEKDHHTGMNVVEVAQSIYDYTSGYPYMVSRICMLIDEAIEKNVLNATFAWSAEGVKCAVKELLTEANTLFDDMKKKLDDFPELRSMLYEILIERKEYSYEPYQTTVNIASTFGYIKNDTGIMKVANRIFEKILYNWFTFDEDIRSNLASSW